MTDFQSTYRFQKIGPIRGTRNAKNRDKVTAMDIFDLLSHIGKPGLDLFNRIKATYDYRYNTCYLETSKNEKDTSATGYKRLMNTIKRVENSGLLLRVAGETIRTLRVENQRDFWFLINPHFIVPDTDCSWTVDIAWNELSNQRVKKLDKPYKAAVLVQRHAEAEPIS